MHIPLRILFAAFITGLSLAAIADDPPERVGRISYVQGLVLSHGDDQAPWVDAMLNTPLLSGSALWTSPISRSEAQVGSLAIRLDYATEMKIARMDYGATVLELPRGVLNIQFATPPSNGSVEVLTPQAALVFTHPGTYHIDAGQPGLSPAQTQVTVLEGAFDIKTSQLTVMRGETATVAGTPPVISLEQGNATAFDDWTLITLEHRSDPRYAEQYVSPHTTGFQDLDNLAYGHWATDTIHGPVWCPATTRKEWAPYRYGQWVYISPFGWNWISQEPWAFAPFHYGRWIYGGGSWCWAPGRIAVRPAYVPAAVAFLGESNPPQLGWVPLAPEELYHPPYPAGTDYIRDINAPDVNPQSLTDKALAPIADGTLVSYLNRDDATLVPAGTFTAGQNVITIMETTLGPRTARKFAAVTHAQSTQVIPIITRLPTPDQATTPASPYTDESAWQLLQPFGLARIDGSYTTGPMANNPPEQAAMQESLMHSVQLAPPSDLQLWSGLTHPQQTTRMTATNEGWRRTAPSQK